MRATLLAGAALLTVRLQHRPAFRASATHGRAPAICTNLSPMSAVCVFVSTTVVVITLPAQTNFCVSILYGYRGLPGPPAMCSDSFTSQHARQPWGLFQPPS